MKLEAKSRLQASGSIPTLKTLLTNRIKKAKFPGATLTFDTASNPKYAVAVSFKDGSFPLAKAKALEKFVIDTGSEAGCYLSLDESQSNRSNKFVFVDEEDYEDYSEDASTADQGKRDAEKDIKEGWVGKDDVKAWTFQSINKHLNTQIGASPAYSEAYMKRACEKFKLPVPKVPAT